MAEKKKKGRLGTRELVAIIFVMAVTRVSDMTPSLLAQTGKNAFWLIPFISFLFIGPSIWMLLYLLKKYNNKNLVELMYHLFGKPIGFLISFGLFLFLFIAVALDSRAYAEQINVIYFPASPLIVIYVLFMVACLFGVRRGFEVLGATSYLVLPYLMISAIILLFLMSKEVILLRINPIFGDGLGLLIKEGVQRTNLFGDLIVITMAYSLFEKGKDFRKGIAFGSGIVVLFLTLIFLSFSLLFDYKTIEHVVYPFHDAIKLITIGQVFTNIETIYLGIWLIASLLRFMLYLYFTTWIFSAVFGIEKFGPLLVTFAYLIIMAGNLPRDAEKMIFDLRSIDMNFASYFLMVFPILMWVIAKMKGELKTNESS